MPFHQKSAWIMLLALLLSGFAYFAAIAKLSDAAGVLVPPNAPFVVVYTIVLVIIAIVGHILIAALAPKDANATVDERERMILSRAGHSSSYVLGLGVLLSLGAFLVLQDGNLLFYMVFASLMLAQLAEYAAQIALYRLHT